MEKFRKGLQNSEYTIMIDFYMLNDKIIVAESQHGCRVRALETYYLLVTVPTQLLIMMQTAAHVSTG